MVWRLGGLHFRVSGPRFDRGPSGTLRNEVKGARSAPFLLRFRPPIWQKPLYNLNEMKEKAREAHLFRVFWASDLAENLIKP